MAGSGIAVSTVEGSDREKKVFAHHMGSLNVGRGAMAWHTRNPELGNPAYSNGGDYRTVPLVPYDMYDMTLDESADLQIRRAMRIGIDGFAVNAWAGGDQAKDFLDALFRVAEQNDYPFEISICPDPNTVEQPHGLTRAWADAIKYLVDRHGNSPKLARRDGKPIIFGYQNAFVWVEYLEKKYNNDRVAVDIARTTPEGWALVGEAYNNLANMVGQPLYFQFDMGAFYHGLQTAWAPENGLARAAAVVAQSMPAVYEFLPSNETRGIASATVGAGAEWGHPIFMNYDNPRTPTTFGGPGTDTLQELWSAAREFDSTLLQLSTWNDYHENTNVSPGTNNNYAYFDLTGYFIAWWKAGQQPVPTHDRMYVFSRKYPRWSKMYPFQDQQGSDGVIEVVTILPEPARIRVMGRGEYDAPAGLFHQQFPVTAGYVTAELIRDGVIELVVKTPEPVSDRPFRQDNGITGISSECEAHWRADFGDIPQSFYSEYGDIDGDGLPNWFEMYYFGHFGDLSTATNANPDEDVNGDGYTNLEAYLLQRSPIAPPGTQPEPIARGPFTGSPILLPGRIQAELFDHGGPGIAYYDTTQMNEGGQFRPNEHVGIEITTDEGGGYNVGWMASGEWMRYTVNVEASGVYDLHVRVARADAGSGQLRFFFDGEDVSGAVGIPRTGGWQQWETIVVPGINLKAGLQTLQVAVGTGGFNLNYIDIVPREVDFPPTAIITSPVANSVFAAGDPVEIVADARTVDGTITKVEFFANDTKLSKVRQKPYQFSTVELSTGIYMLTVKTTNDQGISASSEPVRIEIRQGRAPFYGVAMEFPGRIRAKDFDLGGQDVSYHDSTPVNEGGGYRLTERVDLEPTTDVGGGYNLGWTAPGEWLLYTLDVRNAGAYDLAVRVATIADNTRFRMEFEGIDPITVDIPNTKGWQNWTTVTFPEVALKKGVQTMRLYSETGNFNLNYIEAQALDPMPTSSFKDWMSAHFSPEELEIPVLASATADASGNGISNLMSYALNQNPRSSTRDALPDIGEITLDGEKYLTLTFRRPIGIQDVKYQVEVSTDLESWSGGDENVVLVSVKPDKDSEVVVTRDAVPLKSLTKRLIRLRVEQIVDELSEQDLNN